MKKVLLLLFVFLSANTYSQTCLPEGIILEIQDDVDNFSSNYPGCIEILGNVTVTFDINDLAGLNQIQRIHGSLNINNLSGISRLNGFESLVAVDSTLMISNLQVLDTLILPSNLSQIHALRVTHNESLKYIDGLDQFQTIEGDITFLINSALESINDATNLERVGGSITFNQCQSLKALPRFSSLKKIDQDLRINDTDLKDLVGFESLDTVGDELYINRNNSLTSINGLNELDHVETWFQINNNDNLTSIDGFHSLEKVNGQFVLSSSGFTELNGFENLNAVRGNFTISHCRNLTSLEEFSSLNNLNNNELELIGLWNLQSLDGLQNINKESISNIEIIQVGTNHSELFCSLNNICEYLEIETNSDQISANSAGCADRADVLANCISGLENGLDNVNFYLFPNPASAYLIIELIYTQMLDVKIISIDGSVVYQTNITSTSELDIDAFPSGSYILQVSNNKESSYSRFIKQ